MSNQQKPDVVIKDSDSAIVIYGRILNSLETLSAVKLFVQDIYKIYDSERERILEISKKYVNILQEN
jgi:hypothetical protein